MAEMKPEVPPCTGRQFSSQAEYYEPHFGEYDNVLVSEGKENHENATPGMGAFNYDAKHYDTDFDGGYGENVGKPSASETDVNAGAADRGDE